MLLYRHMEISNQTKNLITSRLSMGELIYMPTDTIPGLACSVAALDAIELLYQLKQRDHKKPPTIIISELHQLTYLSVTLPRTVKSLIEDGWPPRTSYVLEVQDYDTTLHLHRGRGSLAIRMTADPELKQIIDISGPLATSSANIQDQPPSTSSEQARKHFGDSIVTYIEHPPIVSSPSAIYRIAEDGSLEQIR